MKLQYDIPVEVTQKEYYYLIKELSTFIAGRVSAGKYYIKAWLHVGYCNDVFNELRNSH